MKKIIIAIFAFLPIFANAEFFSGNKLNSFLNGTDSEKAIAYGYIAGVFDLGLTKIHCAPEGVTLNQAVDVSKVFLLKNPQHRERSADVLVGAALAEVWDCGKKSSGPQKQI